MADTAAQIREARRRRILENSESRLKRITGSYSNASPSDPTNDALEGTASYEETSPITSIRTDKSTVKEPRVINNVEPYMESLPASGNVPVIDESFQNHTSSDIKSPLKPADSSSQKKSSVLYNLCWKARLHIVALAVIVRILLTLPCAVLFGESALIPLCTVEFAEWLNTKLQTEGTQNSPSGLLGMALMLSGVAPQKITHLQGILDIFNRISQDFCIYFFALFTTHALLEIFS